MLTTRAQGDTAQAHREMRAEMELDALFTEHIEPFFKEMGDVSVKLEVEAFSQEQDELHQFADCMMMGPYGAADMHARFATAAGTSQIYSLYIYIYVYISI